MQMVTAPCDGSPKTCSASLETEEGGAIFAEDQIEAGLLFGKGAVEVMPENDRKRHRRLETPREDLRMGCEEASLKTAYRGHRP